MGGGGGGGGVGGGSFETSLIPAVEGVDFSVERLAYALISLPLYALM